MAILTYDEAIRIAVERYKEALPPGVPSLYTQIEWAWLTGLATRASVMLSRVGAKFTVSWTLLYYVKEGINWQVRVEQPTVRKAGIMEIRQEPHIIPPATGLTEALQSAKKFALWWDEWAPHVYLALQRQDQGLSGIYQMLSPMKYLRTPSGWLEVETAWIELRESFKAPGPKPKRLIQMSKDIIRAFPTPISYPHGEIDLMSTAVRIIVSRLPEQ